ncbi:MAG: Ig-like domain-containing protein [Candidatus Hydrogenedentales bacterium]
MRAVWSALNRHFVGFLLILVFGFVWLIPSAHAATLQWVQQSPAGPIPGDSVTLTIRLVVALDEPGESLPLNIIWKRPDGSEMARDSRQVNLLSGEAENFATTKQCPSAGVYTVEVVNTGGTAAVSMGTRQVPVFQPLSGDTAAAALQATFTHTPANPIAVWIQPWMSPQPTDDRDLITLTCNLKNTHATMSVPGGDNIRVEVKATSNAAVCFTGTYAFASWAPGATQTTQWQFKMNAVPGDYYVECKYHSNGQWRLVASNHHINAVPSQAPSFSNPKVTPAQGFPADASTTYVYEVTFTDPTNTAPTSVKIAFDSGQLLDMQNALNDTTYTDGAVYRYNRPGPLALGDHNFQMIAYRPAGTDVARVMPTPGPVIADPNPPVVTNGGTTLPNVTITDSGQVSLSGTASDAESGVTAVEWRLSGGTWSATQGTTAWSFTYNAGVADQGHATKTFQVRAKDGAGNLTPANKYWTQTVVWERRHPMIVSSTVMGTGLKVIEPNQVLTTRPVSAGNPLKGEFYNIVFEVKNPNPSTSYPLNLAWKEKYFNSNPGTPRWDLNMQDPVGESGTIPFTLGPNETKWVCTTWSHDWNWIEEPSIFDFLWDFGTMWIDSNILDVLDLLQLVENNGSCVRKTTWSTEAGAAMSPILIPPTQYIGFDVKVPTEKEDLLFTSSATGVCGMAGTAVAAAASWTAIVGIVGAVYEVGCIAAANVIYVSAWDPDPDYKSKVKVIPLKIPEIDQIEDENAREEATAAVRLVENARAMQKAYVKYAGAMKANDPKAAASQITDAAEYAKAASIEAKRISAWVQKNAPSLTKLSAEERKKIADEFSKGLPKQERDLMDSFGLNDKEIKRCEELHEKLMPKLLDNPKQISQSAKSMATGFDSTVRALDKIVKQAAKP